jgi:hypothetical protein
VEAPRRSKETATRATQEYLATLDDAEFGAASPMTPKFISRSDPAAQWSGITAEATRGEGVDRDREGASREQASRIDWRREEELEIS